MKVLTPQALTHLAKSLIVLRQILIMLIHFEILHSPSRACQECKYKLNSIFSLRFCVGISLGIIMPI